MIARSTLGVLSLGPRRGERFRLRPSPPLQGRDPATHPVAAPRGSRRGSVCGETRGALRLPVARFLELFRGASVVFWERGPVHRRVCLYPTFFCLGIRLSHSSPVTVFLSPSVNLCLCFLWKPCVYLDVCSWVRESLARFRRFSHPQSHCRATSPPPHSPLFWPVLQALQTGSRTPTETSVNEP